ncbi:MAG: DJ-1/PfpI family protein [Proteobacteria bacterium]|nr:MAG: DJ-1/PfpI family protein [Pseudomonadota bacterium]
MHYASCFSPLRLGGENVMKKLKCSLILFISAWSLMPLTSSAKTTTIAFLVYDKMNVLDYAGPREVLSQVGFSLAEEKGGDKISAFTVGFPQKEIRAIEGTQIVADYGWGDAIPAADIIIVPGARDEDVPLDLRILVWLKEHAAANRQLMSVCTGAYFLGEAGLLNGKKATTHHLSFPRFKAQYPGVKLQEKVRYVEEKNILTTAGVSAGIDGAFHLAARLFGLARAEKVAELMEYRWVPGAR